MVHPPTPSVEFDDIVTKILRSRRVRECFKDIVEEFVKSYLEGHSGDLKQKAYLNASVVVKSLDYEMIRIFNWLMYR